MATLRDPRRAPSHPGELLREDILPALRMTQTEFAQRLGVSRLTVSELLHEKRALTPDMAARIAKLLRGSAAFWLRLQAARDLWEIEQDRERLAKVRPLDKRTLEAA
jgi:addiction module HigA family antidote